jgi:MFS family permease
MGFRLTLLMGAAFAVAGAAVLLRVQATSSIGLLAAACFVMGIGFGFVASPAVVAAQSSVTWRHRGVVTGANMFGRSVGSAVGVAVFGAVANTQVADRLAGAPGTLDHVPGAVLAPALHDVYVVSAVLALTLLLIGALMPHRLTAPDPDPDADPASPGAEATSTAAV